MNRPDPKTADRRAMKRRRFIHILAASGAVMAATGLPGVSRGIAGAAQPKGRAARAKQARSAAIQREIDNQKKSVSDMVTTVRAYELPPGSDPSFAFRAIRARRGGR